MDMAIAWASYTGKKARWQSEISTLPYWNARASNASPSEPTLVETGGFSF